MRSKTAAAMQKTYDDCYLTCSTAIYFEGQHNEAEALRSWKMALDQINYHNAFKVPTTYRPKSETEKALQESLRQMELQCKERVDLLEALKRSRKEVGATKDVVSSESTKECASDPERVGWLGGGTIPPVEYPDLSRPPLPMRPAITARKTSGSEATRTRSLPQTNSEGLSLPPLQPLPTVTLSVPTKKSSRTPSPDKKPGMLRTLRPGRDGPRASSSKVPNTLRSRPPVAAKAASQAWGTTQRDTNGRVILPYAESSRSSVTLNASRESLGQFSAQLRRPSHEYNSSEADPFPQQQNNLSEPFFFRYDYDRPGHYLTPAAASTSDPVPSYSQSAEELTTHEQPPTPPPHVPRKTIARDRPKSPQKPPKNGQTYLSYRKEYPNSDLQAEKLKRIVAARPPRSRTRAYNHTSSSGSEEASSPTQRQRGKQRESDHVSSTPDSLTSEADFSEPDPKGDAWKMQVAKILKNLPKGVDEAAAKQILNEIIIHGDEVHWDDVAGLDIAKSALKETVVYPFLRPDLFMGLREPARGMLLFGPPGTGKTMLARAVATESRSTFFAISASSLTSKFLGESEKLVRALFQLAKALAPSIIFVDEIDSLLSSRSGSSEHEATRRIKTEFLIQWSDLAKAAAGREQTEKDKKEGDASRVLVLAATNLPWAIDEAARRRFVRRQYIPLPEPHVRKLQLKTLLSHQKHDLKEKDLDNLVELTDSFSGSDITALAKDAAMGPLRSLGEKLLHMTMDEIRPIQFEDFKASLTTIRPSVSKEGLKQFEDWATAFGERGG
ncbi:AAA-domain-containing protein [Patellaria atrata CBS 101060]|uniref:AAA-domain-containing protein n=1 Tax=Patellaria atrata CBS 101060 TaxID=1346257 RepID=A0A9P4S611_9PEZI|nr:AAA-domain-containing protein [Patellaria atrata CBS 101060]